MPTRRTFLAASGAAALLAFAGRRPAAQAGDDPRMDAAYFETKIKRIDDADLFASLDLTRAELGEVRADVERKDFPGAYAAWAEYWPTVSARGTFRGDASFIYPRQEAASSIAGGRGEIIELAAKVMRHEIKGWGDLEIKHGPVIDFNADYGKSGKYGFHYWGFASPLVQAYLLTEEQKYLDEFEQLFNQWYEQRDKVKGDWPGLDVIWYELGVGVRNRIFLEFYFLPQAKRSMQTHERMLKTLLGSARWLEAEEAGGYRDGNWQMIGSYGLAQIGLMVPEFAQSRAWVQLGTQRTLDHLDRDFFADGCHSERCPSSYTVIAYRDPRNLARMLADDPAHAASAAKLREPLARALDFWIGVLPPDGILCGINDGSRSPMLAPMMQDGFDLFGRRDMLWIKRHIVGAETKEEGTEPARRSVHFAPSGFTAMRSDWSKDARFMLINHGPWGSGHSHADSLSFNLNAFGRAMAIDSGIGHTYDDPNQLTWFVHSPAHNMLTVDGDDIDRKAATGIDVVWQSDERFDHFAATHRGYLASKGIVHRRQIVFVKPDFFVVFDSIDASASKAQRLLEWQLHLTVPTETNAGPGLIVQFSEAWDATRTKAPASVLGVPGFKEQYSTIDWMKLTRPIAAGETLNVAVLIFPFAAARPETQIERAGDAAFVVHHPCGETRLTFAHDAVGFKARERE